MVDLMAERTLAGDVVVFAGRLMSMTRRQATDLVRRLGGRPDQDVSSRTTLLVVGADTPGGAEGSPPDPDVARKLRKARELQQRTPEQPLVIDEDRFCDAAGRVTPTALRAHYYPVDTIRGLYPAIRDDHLRYLENWGLLTSVVRTPGGTYVGFRDLATIRHAAADLEAGASFRAVLRALSAADRGQLRLDFFGGAGEPPSGGTVVSLSSRPVRVESSCGSGADPERTPGPAEQKFLAAQRLEIEADGDPETVMAAYREALAVDPSLVPALVNLGNLHYGQDALAEAAALYVQAALVAPDCFEAYYNLGNVHHDQGRLAMAAACYEEAIRMNARFAEAHFYLAVTLEKMGRSEEALPMWRRYLELAPDGEWVALAREFSEA
jgi:tetratricopeptide (TPR) repeat protein